MPSKKPYLSKTLWLNFIVALLALASPAARDFVVGNPQFVIVGFALINMVLRLVTNNAIQLEDDAAPSEPPATPPSA